ncbi:MAG: hypothetical protein Ct9H300mP32_3560 [Verrucomicrobiota bacterium]|nr:MAG: hypothetical protein Ct9H300mP32_3560 [Verrucomicrobiota bacterium]
MVAGVGLVAWRWGASDWVCHPADRVSIVGFYLGLYALTGLVWGPGPAAEPVFSPSACLRSPCRLGRWQTLSPGPLRHLVSDITGWICGTYSAWVSFPEGVQIFDSKRPYNYEIAAA